MIIKLVVLIAIVFIFILLIRTLNFKPQNTWTPSGDPVELDQDTIVSHLQEMIRCKTISYDDSELIDEQEFEKFQELLKSLYPELNKISEQMIVGVNGILYRWKGCEEGDPAVFMAHYDVVPVEEEQWEKPAFEAVIEEGCIWGRGTLDTKGTLCGMLEAAEKLIKEGFVPEHDIYFAFSGQEEINGTTASDMVDWFDKQGIHPAIVLDEGGAVVEDVFPGVSGECALIGIAEKGFASVELRLKSRGGHASTPPVHTVVGELAKAVVEVEKHPFPGQITKPVREMLDTLGRHSSFGYKLLFANMWCFQGIFNKICQKTGGELNAMVRTTCAVTRMKGSKAFNVIPPVASAGMNLRLMGTDTIETVKEHLSKVVKNPDIEIHVAEARNPSVESDTACAEWNHLCQAVADTWPEAIVSPYLMLAASDSWYYCKITDRIYKFSAMKLSDEERAMIHGNNERVPIETMLKTTEFYYRILRTC